jgi:23S rRNA (cytosine1962-C5)-methyltransferase
VEVVDADGRSLGTGLLSEGSAIRVRLLHAACAEGSVESVLVGRVRDAAALRARLFPDPSRTDAYRLVHSEGDGLPGLVVDRFGEVLVAQLATGPMFRRAPVLAEALLQASGARTLVTRPGGYEEEEGIDAPAGGLVFGAPPPERVEAHEEGMTLFVEPRTGQKTGHYCDQRESRVLVAALARGAEVLDLYGGTGGFSIQALRHGATSALLVDSSERATEVARAQAESNGVADRLEVLREDARHVLSELRIASRLFDVVVLDPPNFFPRRGGGAREEHAALKAHRETNVRALTRVRRGGFLATFTCSAQVDPVGFRELVLSAARECRRTVSVLRELSAGPDHPVASPEGRYLTGLLLAVRDAA